MPLSGIAGGMAGMAAGIFAVKRHLVVISYLLAATPKFYCRLPPCVPRLMQRSQDSGKNNPTHTLIVHLLKTHYVLVVPIVGKALAPFGEVRSDIFLPWVSGAKGKNDGISIFNFGCSKTT